MGLETDYLVSTYEILTDTSGRRINADSSTRYIQSHLPGRQHTVTDTEALQEYVHNGNDVQSLMSFVRSGYPQERLTFEQMMDLACAVHTLPVFVILRRFSPVGMHSLPAATIDASRAVAGIMMVSAGMMESDFAEDSEVDENVFYNFANGNNPQRRNYFVERGDISCPAPEGTVKGVLRTMIYRPTKEISLNVEDWHGLIKRDELANLLSFGFHYTSFREAYRAVSKTLEARRIPNRTDLETMVYCYPRVNTALGYGGNLHN